MTDLAPQARFRNLKDAAAACEVSAKEKKLAGAAKTSFTKKCVSDAEGT